jgi:hypothetical protein
MRIPTMMLLSALTAALVVGAAWWKLPPVGPGLELLAGDVHGWARAEIAARR